MPIKPTKPVHIPSIRFTLWIQTPENYRKIERVSKSIAYRRKVGAYAGDLAYIGAFDYFMQDKKLYVNEVQLINSFASIFDRRITDAVRKLRMEYTVEDLTILNYEPLYESNFHLDFEKLIEQIERQGWLKKEYIRLLKQITETPRQEDLAKCFSVTQSTISRRISALIVAIREIQADIRSLEFEYEL